MVFGNIFRRDPFEAAAADLYRAIVVQAREPVFYERAAVPDTIDGRFEMISLHAFLVMRQLKGKDAAVKRKDGAAQKLSQAVFDCMFDDMDRSLREIGVGDLSVGKRIKQMAKAFYGRVVAYETALDGGEETLEMALLRNHYGTVDAVPEAAVAGLAHYVRTTDRQLAAGGVEALIAGKACFETPILGGQDGVKQ